ncbi:MAG: isoleucine--tRNA ligase [Omnitrophica WOR_2 bacterium GWA2_47_8]|nr:MAG: isoleucine--tRNA ligase [Omnitrophica WOR_2 bacterium GWA2_47_8]
MDYQKTLNLPQTDFPMKANLVQREPALLEKWYKDGLYFQIRNKSKGKKTFILHDGPPYANGNIHIGHALNKILKDMIVKFRNMEGYDSIYVPGWDCHGLPIEHQLFKELKKKKSEVDTVEFRKKAHEFAMKYVNIQREEFKRLGVLGDWEHPYLTLTPEYEYWILKSFAQLVKKGYIYHGLKPVNWCFDCETALAEAEVEYEDHTSPSAYVKFKVNNPQALKEIPKGKDVYLLIWTTTPWTLLANVAVAVHPAYLYELVEVNNEILIIEKTLVERVMEKTGIKKYSLLKEISGEKLKNLLYQHPFGIKENCRVITVDYVTRDDGTGLVHTAPGHGQEDFEAGQLHNLEILMPVNDRGVFTEQGGPFKGQHVFKANPEIINDLKNRGFLFLSEDIPHSYPHCWRCKKPIIFRATQQWFLKIDHDNLRGKLKEAIKHRVKWIPETGEERILGMVTTRPDWCLSRQRHWGVPIPALLCLGCGKKHKLFVEVIEHLADIVKKSGSDAWFEKDIKDLLPKNFKCPDCKKSQFEKTYDILDVWFDSGVSHQAVVKAMLKKELPIELYLEGSDQHRGWFQSSLIPAVAMEGKPPYAAVLTHGFVVDGEGRKMSKSLGNVIAPQEIMKNNGADILRLWVASSSYHDDIRLSKEILDRMVDSYRKIRNTFRYLLSNLYDFNPQKDEVSYDDILDIDKWALYKLNTLIRDVRQSYDLYDFAKVTKLIFAFCNEDLSSFYLDILKDRLYTSPSKSAERRSAQTVLYYILTHLVGLLAPVLSFTTEEVFNYMPKNVHSSLESSVHLLVWEKASAHWDNEHIAEKFKLLIDLRPFVLKALEEKRRNGSIGSSLEAKVIFKTASQRDHDYLNSLAGLLPSIFIVSQVEIKKVASVEEGLGEVFAKTAVAVEKADGEKCIRCWAYRTDIGVDKEHAQLCGRCLKAIKEESGLK